MVKSMTAYGRAAGEADGKHYLVEMKSVNNRFLDLTVKLPRSFGYLEEKIKNAVTAGGISRGKMEIYVGIDVAEGTGTASLDPTYAESYLRALYELRDRFGLTDDITVMSVAANRDLFTVVHPEEDAEKVWAGLKPVFDEALAAFLAARQTEGDNLRADLTGKKEKVKVLAEKIRALSGTNTEAYRSRLEGRLRQTLGTLDIVLDEGRILTECAIFADKIAVDEEMVRLDSHFKAFDEALASDEPAGRRLDFLLQEMNREINTTGSKSGDAEIAKLVVDAKCELEKIREQIQNIE